MADSVLIDFSKLPTRVRNVFLNLEVKSWDQIFRMSARDLLKSWGLGKKSLPIIVRLLTDNGFDGVSWEKTTVYPYSEAGLRFAYERGIADERRIVAEWLRQISKRVEWNDPLRVADQVINGIACGEHRSGEK